jgi:RecA-family ATPase
LARIVTDLDDIVGPYEKGAGVFVAVNQTDLKGRETGNVICVRAVWQDDDSGGPPIFPLPPSIVVESSPGKFQRYWLVDGDWPADKQGSADFAAVMGRMVAAYGSDPGAKDIARVLRVPGFLHRKNPAAPFMVRIVEATGRRYTREEICRAFPPVEKVETSRRREVVSHVPRANGLFAGFNQANVHDTVARVRDAIRHIPAAVDYETWLRVGMALKAGDAELGGAGLEILDTWSKSGSYTKYDAREIEYQWTKFDPKSIGLGTLFHFAREHGWQSGQVIAFPAGDEPEIEQPAPLGWLDMSKWDGEPVPRRKWAILDRVPMNQAGLFSGEGGTGKSIIELQKNVAHVMGRDWLGSLPEPGPAIYIGAEDDKDEIHIRLAAIAAHYGVTFRELSDGGLHVLCLLGQDATLCAVPGKSGRVETTGLYRRLYEAAGDIKPKNISIDTLSRAFAGSEIDRVQVYAFAMHMQALAMVAGGSVTVLSHPSLAGISSGSGISGSTAWHGAFRFRQYLTGIKAAGDGEQPDNDVRELEFKKNQYGPRGESIALRYQGGLFLPEAGVSSLDKLAREQFADGVFLAILRRYEREGRNVGEKPTAPTYAPKMFAQERDAEGCRKKELEGAMRRLFAANKIHVEQYGRPSRPASRICLGSPQ